MALNLNIHKHNEATLSLVVSSNFHPPPPCIIFGFLCSFLALATSFYGSQMQGLRGGFLLPLTLALSCFMWIKIKKPVAYGPIWLFNCTLGC